MVGDARSGSSWPKPAGEWHVMLAEDFESPRVTSSKHAPASVLKFEAETQSCTATSAMFPLMCKQQDLSHSCLSKSDRFNLSILFTSLDTQLCYAIPGHSQVNPTRSSTSLSVGQQDGRTSLEDLSVPLHIFIATIHCSPAVTGRGRLLSEASTLVYNNFPSKGREGFQSRGLREICLRIERTGNFQSTP